MRRPVRGGDFLDRVPSQPQEPGLADVKLVISDAHTGLKAAIAGVFDATWQRCRVHWIRNALPCAQGSEHRIKLPNTNSLERLNKEVKRRADVVRIFPNEESIIRLLGAVLFEQNDEWQSQHRYMQVEAFAQMDAAEATFFSA